MGRPIFKIDHVRLRALREEKGLTQAALAEKVAQQLGTQITQSLGRHYQRIEVNGQTSNKYAKALATVLGVSVSMLQGLDDPDPSAYLLDIQRLLEEQITTGTNSALLDLLKYHAKNGDETALKYLAEDIAERIEQVLLIRSPTKIADLIRLTGLSEADILAPANVRGFWFISVRSHVINCTEIVNDSSSVNFRIGEIMGAFIGDFGNDSRVRMWRDNPWIRIEVNRHRPRDTMHIDITRCQPDAGGVRWVDASWRDVFFLFPGIVSHAYATADVVTDFSDKTVPGDPHRLRLVVTEHEKTFGKVLRRMVVRGNIDEIPEKVKENFAEEGSTRILFMSWLTAGLRYALMPHLTTHPASSWLVSTCGGGAVDIKVKEPRYGFAELRYRIVLAEEVAPHIFDEVPVRKRDLEELQKKIENWLAEGYFPVDDADPTPVFEPI